MYSDLMSDGLTLMVIGMGTVFVFLTVAVVSVAFMSKLAKSIEARLPVPDSAPIGVPPEHVAAITAAVTRYRTSRNQ